MLSLLVALNSAINFESTTFSGDPTPFQKEMVIFAGAAKDTPPTTSSSAATAATENSRRFIPVTPFPLRVLFYPERGFRPPR